MGRNAVFFPITSSKFRKTQLCFREEDAMIKKTVAITGASGRIGVNVVQHLHQAGYEVRALLHSPLPAGHPLSQEHALITVLDLSTLPEQAIADWLNETQPMALIHSAGLSD